MCSTIPFGQSRKEGSHVMLFRTGELWGGTGGQAGQPCSRRGDGRGPKEQGHGRGC